MTVFIVVVVLRVSNNIRRPREMRDMTVPTGISSTSAISAAFRDPRFVPVQPEELPRLEIEISVMGPIERVATPDDIIVGRDGLIISRGRQAGLLLPQVATEYGWERETFLAQTCVKAGLSPAAWRAEDTRIERFAAEVFGE